jgi:hypoxia up-regulated 1
MDRNMMLNLQSADARFEEEYDEIVKPTKNATENDTDVAEAPQPQTVKKIRKHNFALTMKRTDEEVPVKRMTSEAKLKAQATLRKMEEQDKARAQKEEARNALEAFSFVSKEKLSTHEDQVKKVLDEAVLEQLRADLSAVEDWIDDHKHAGAEEFLTEKKRLQAGVDKVFHMIREHEERPAAVRAFKRLVNHLEDRRGNWTIERPWIPETVWQIVDKAQEDARKWLQEMEAKQAQLTMQEEPVLTLSLIRTEMEKIQRLVELLLKQRKPAATVTKKTDSAADKKSESTGADSDSKSSSSESTEEQQQEATDGKESEEQASKEEPTGEESTGEEPKTEPKEEL